MSCAVRRNFLVVISAWALREVRLVLIDSFFCLCAICQRPVHRIKPRFCRSFHTGQEQASENARELLSLGELRIPIAERDEWIDAP